MEQLCKHASQQEIKVKTERDSIKYMQAIYVRESWYDL